MFATLQSTVVRLHMASLQSYQANKRRPLKNYHDIFKLKFYTLSSFLSDFSQFCLLFNLVGHIPSRPITMLCHIRPDNNY